MNISNIVLTQRLQIHGQYRYKTSSKFKDDNEVENPFQKRLTNDRNKSATTFVKAVMPATKQSTNRSNRKVETSKPGFISANNSQISHHVGIVLKQHFSTNIPKQVDLSRAQAMEPIPK